MARARLRGRLSPAPLPNHAPIVTDRAVGSDSVTTRKPDASRVRRTSSLLTRRHAASGRDVSDVGSRGDTAASTAAARTTAIAAAVAAATTAGRGLLGRTEVAELRPCLALPERLERRGRDHLRSQRRERQRLATPTPLDNRISYGCINVPAKFFENVVSPAFTGTNGIVYVLPETRSNREVFASYDVEEHARKQFAMAPAL